nr:enoyl-CoA hydratase-related protein [Pseudomonas sp. PSB11]
MKHSIQDIRNVRPLNLHHLPVSVVTVLNGPVVGAGVVLTLAADIVLAAQDAYFYLPFIKTLGLLPDGGASWFLQRHIGRACAVELSLTGKRLSIISGSLRKNRISANIEGDFGRRGGGCRDYGSPFLWKCQLITNQ